MYKLKSKQKAYQKTWYQTHETLCKNRARIGRLSARIRNLGYIDQVKGLGHCVDCGTCDPIVLEFDHKPGYKKCGDVSTMARNLVSLKKLSDEVAKCDLRCANCHRIVTFERRKNLHRSETERSRQPHTLQIAGSTPDRSNQ